MRRTSAGSHSSLPLIAAGTALIAATYGLIRLAYGLFLAEVQADLGFDVAAAGAISSGASVVYCVGAVIGFLAAGKHPRTLIAAAGLSAAAGAAGMAVAPDAATFAVFSILGSAGAGLASPALVAVLQRNASTARHPGAQTIVNAGTGPGLIIAGALALLLLPDWRAAWAISAVFTVAVTVLVLVFDRPDPHTVGAAAHESRPSAAWFARHRRLIAAALLMGCGSAAVWNYGRTFLVDADASHTISVLAWIAIGGGGAAAIATSAWLERLGPRRAWALTVGTVSVATALLILVPGNAPLVLATCAAFGWGYTAGSGALISWTAQIDPPQAPAGTALLFVTLILGQALGASAVGLLIPLGDYSVAFLAAAAASAAAVGVAVWPASEARARIGHHEGRLQEDA